MAITVKTPINSFIQFGEPDIVDHAIFSNIRNCLPIYNENDVAFQFVLETTTDEEMTALSDITNVLIQIGIVNDCDDDDFLIQFLAKPERFKISDRQMLYNWKDGFPGFDSVIQVQECFKVKIKVPLTAYIDYEFCSNCFERIDETAFSSVIEYGNEDNGFGFNYCASSAALEDLNGGSPTCDPTVITFSNKETLSIPYTAGLHAAYGEVPTVQVWIYNTSGELVNSGIQSTMDGFPPTVLNFDFGGMASGIIVLR